MMKKLLLLSSFVVMIAVSGFSQSGRLWSENNESRNAIVPDKSVSRLSYPKEFKLFNVDILSLRKELFSIVQSGSSKRSTIISLPNANGNIEQYEVFEASNFDAELQARFPEIRAYSGKGLTDKYATLKLSISPQGIQAMIFRTETDNEFIEPYSKDHTIYSVYKSQRVKGSLPWTCSTHDQEIGTAISGKLRNNGVVARSGADLKTMRLAQSVTAEYSNYFGATSAAQVSLVLAAINATLARCNGVYEKDLALHLNLIAATTNVIYYNASTDPYSAAATGAGGAWNTELQNTLTSVIGNANYDIGHLFGASGGGGNAGCIGCVCLTGKGSGFTSPADGIPQGDNFDIDYVVHEVGHQLGANHTFSMNNEGSGVNKEPGSGITIMGYAGITSQDLAPHSIDIYHQASISQIQANLLTKTCPITTSILGTNSTPIVAPLTNYTIPKSTPFALTGAASDSNANNVLTYCWEQNDNATSAQTGASSVASATKASGPNWISFKPTVSPTRVFPKLETILAGLQVSGPLTGGDAGANTEALSSVGRTLNFRLTVRDNAPYSSTPPVNVGQTNFADMVVTVSAAAGPFAVTVPNTAVTWPGNSTQTITWSVAGSNGAPVNCANVKISLSTDGGQTFPTVLAANTPNDGTEALTIPNTATTSARIKIEAIGNIFFDISNANFTITQNSGCGTPVAAPAAGITQTSATISWSGFANATSYTLQYKTAAAPSYSSIFGITNTSYNLTGLTPGTTYNFRVQTVCAGSADSSGYPSPSSFTTLTNTGSCVDSYEPNNTWATGVTIPANTAITGLIGISTDNDYYKFSNTANQPNIKVSLTNLPNDYNLKLYNPAGTLLNTSANNGTNAESITYNTSAVGIYTAHVYSNKGVNSATKCYTLLAQIGANPFRMANQEGRMINNTLKVYPTQANGNVALSLNGYKNGEAMVTVIDQSGVLFLSKKIIANSVESNTQLDVSGLPEGLYYVKVQQGTSSNIEKLYVKR